MKFGETLKKSMVPEWRDKYVRFHLLKGMIKKIRKEALSTATAVGSDEQEPLMIDIENMKWEKTFIETFKEDFETVSSFYSSTLESYSSRFENLVQHLVSLNLIDEYNPQTTLGTKESVVEIELKQRGVTANVARPSVPALASNRSGSQIAKQVVRASDNVVEDDLIEEGALEEEIENAEVFPRSLILKTEDKDVVFAAKLSEHKKSKAVRALRDSFEEFYLGLNLLQAYGLLNSKGLQKILKKHDKNVGASLLQDYLPMIQKKNFCKQKELKFLVAETEVLFANAFCDGDLGKAMKTLRVPDKQPGQRQKIFQLGLFSGIAFMFLVFIIYLLCITPPTPDSIPVLIGYRMSLSVIYLLWLWGVDLYVWAKFRINYIFIFNFDPRKLFSFFDIMAASAILTVLWLLSLVVYLLFLAPLPGFEGLVFMPFYVPLVTIIGILFILFLLFQYNSEFWLLRTLKRNLCAPFYEIKFKDFFIGDQLVSLVIMLYDIFYVGCYFSLDIWSTPPTGRCLLINPMARPVLATLPFLTRALQCLRRVRDVNDKMQYVNAGKYVSAIAVIILVGLYRNLREPVGLLIPWVTTAIIATLYGYAWDLKKDWGLLERNSKHPWLRDRILYPAAFYYIIIPLNLVLRVLWVLTISPTALGITLHPELFLTLLSFLEITRRGIWNILRLENEQLNNCGRYRAVRANPLPLQQLFG